MKRQVCFFDPFFLKFGGTGFRTGCSPRAVFGSPLFLVIAMANATPILYLAFKRPTGNFLQGLVPPVNQCLLGQDPRGGVAQDRCQELFESVGKQPNDMGKKVPMFGIGPRFVISSCYSPYFLTCAVIETLRPSGNPDQKGKPSVSERQT